MDKNISAWFRKHSFNVTTTTLRSLSDTQTHELLQHGRISSAFEESMMEINGHSSQMSKDHYRRNSLKAHVQNGNFEQNSIFSNAAVTTIIIIIIIIIRIIAWTVVTTNITCKTLTL